MTSYGQHVSMRKTPQSEAIPGTDQVPNSSGGFSFAVDDWTRLDRFLILGCEGGSYYASERQLTIDNAGCVFRCLSVDPNRTINRIIDISVSGRAPKNDAAIFALAIAASFKPDIDARRFALNYALPAVCRTGTHLFQFNEAIEHMRGRGRMLKRAIQNWYLDMPPDKLAYQVVKYQQRNGWSHRDLLRLCKPKGATGAHQEIFKWVVGKNKETVWERDDASLDPIWALEMSRKVSTEREIIRLIRDHSLPREAVPSEWLAKPAVWEALLEKLPPMAMVRNLGVMTYNGLLAPLSAHVKTVVDRLGNAEYMRKARVHPIAILSAMLTYQSGKGVKGTKTWTPIQPIVSALNDCFYRMFADVEPTNKRWLLALDISGSMDQGTCAGVPGLTPRIGAAAMALVTAAVESEHHFVAFTAEGYCKGLSLWSQMHGMGGLGSAITPLTISPKQRIDDVCRQVRQLPMGGTDCALPMIYAMEQKIPVDVFTVFTDSETWAGNIHPAQALQAYRDKTGINAKLIVVGMVANHFSIADPNDAGMLDVVGFDKSAPSVMADFGRDERDQVLDDERVWDAIDPE